MLGLAPALALLAGCGGREHTNPFDPDNPDTRGEPAAVQAMAGCRRVDLLWTNLGIADIRGFRLWRERLGPDPTGPIPLTDEPLEASARIFTDEGAVNGEPYAYTIEFVFTRGSSAAVRPARARPGPAALWVADPCGYGLSRLSPDGRGLLRRIEDGAAVLAVEIDEGAHRLYAAEVDAGRVLVAGTADGSILRELAAPGASCLDWNPELEVLAVGAFYEQSLSWLSPSGERVADLALEGHPEDVALRDSVTTWVALYEGPLLRAGWDGAGVARAELVCDSLERAVRVLDDPEGGGCWVADRAGGRVAYVADDGGAVFTPAGLLGEPLDLAPAAQGGCWVADRAGRGAVRLDRLCRILERRGDVPRAAGVREDPRSGALWLAVPETGEVWRFDPDGEQVALVLDGCPRRMAGDWLGGCAGAEGEGSAAARR